MMFERINASGVGLTIGSIGASAAHTCVRNITFRDSVMPNSFKGLYLKSRPESDPQATGEITDVLYENIVMNNPTQWAIWIGPQQASYAGACNLFWPFLPGTQCPVPSNMNWSNLIFRNITINSPQISPGVIIGNETNPMQNIVFDGVVVNNPGVFPWGSKYYMCTDVEGGVAKGGTNPVPPCFNTKLD
jgi:polygalacturonase